MSYSKLTIYIIVILSTLAFARVVWAASPTVTTQSASDVTSSTATGNGNITNTGGENNDVRGFIYTANDGSRAAHYKFEYGASTTDSSGFGNNLTNVNAIVSSTTDYMQGTSSSEIELGSSQYYKITDAALSSNFPLKSGTTNKIITICAWFKAESLVSNTLYVNALVSKIDTSSNRRSIGMRISYYDGVNHKLDGLIGYNSGGNSEIKQHSTNITTGNWYHATLSFDDSDKSMALRLRDSDGNVVGSDVSTTTDNNISLTTEDWRIGAQFAGDSVYSGSLFDGLIDDVMIFDRFLTADEVTAIAKGNVAPASSGYDYYAEDSGTYGTGAFTKSLTGLDPVTTYFMRAYSHNSEGYSYGDEFSFTTETAPLTADTRFTVSAWVKPTVSIATTALAVKNNEIRLVTDLSGYPVCQIHNGTNWLTAATSSRALELSRWAYVACTYDGEYIKIYINGFAVATEAETSSLANTANDWVFGDDPGGTYGDYQGFMDEVKIYPYARSAEQILADYAVGLAGQGTAQGVSAAFGDISDKWLTDGLVGYWKMDEPVGTYDDDNGYEDANDSSGSAYTGDANGNASTTGAKFGNGGIFDGTGDYIKLDNDLLDSHTVGSIGAWVYVSNTATNKTVIGFADSAGYLQKAGILVDTSEKVELFVRRNDSANELSLVTNNSLPIGQWSHILVTQDGELPKIYINGVEASTTVTTLTGTAQIGDWFSVIAAECENVDIGQLEDNTPSEYFAGKIDDLRLYNRVLSPDEARKLYEWVPGPVAHWRLDEKTGNTAYDSAASSTYSGGNHGQLGYSSTVSSSSPAWTRGKYGSALDFDGTNDYVDIGNPPGLNNIAEKTISAWIKMDSFGGANGGRIIEKEHGLAGGWFFSVYGGTALGNQYSIRYLHHFTGTADYGVWTSATNTIAVGDWYHVAVTFNNSSGTNIPTFYINGIAQTTTIFRPTTGVSVDDSASVAYIGKRADEVVSFNGKIDDVRIYNYARTQKQILEDMTARGGSASGGSAGLYPMLDFNFDEGKGTTTSNSGLATSSGALNCGTAGSNTATSAMWTMDGAFGKAIEFDGTDDYINIDDVFYSDAVSICTWFKSDVDVSAITKTLVSKRNISGITSASGSNFEWNLQAEDGEVMFASWETGGGGATALLLYSETSIQTNTWYHVCAVQSGNGKMGYLYLNGKLEDSAAQTAVMFNTSNKIQVGVRTANNNARYWDGMIDEVKIYNYPLTEDEVKADYNSGMAAVMGQTGKSSVTATSSNSASLEYCVPGSTDYCAAPVGEWKMEEKSGATAYDTSGNGLDGTLGGGTVGYRPIWARGKIGSALNFDGIDDYVQVANDSLLNSSIFSISFWAMVDTQDTSGQRLIQKYDVDDSDGMNFTVMANNDATYPSRFRFGLKKSTTGYYAYSTTSIENGQWYYVSGTYDGSNSKIYINGLFEDEDTSAQYTNSTDPLYFGSEDGNAQLFDGLIDQVRIYNYERTPAQIAYEFNRGKPIAQWSFDECKGGTIYDSAISWNGATSSNGTLYLGTSGVTATGTCASASNSFWSNGSTGKVNSAGSFDGTNDYINMGDVNNLDGLSAMTVSAWIKTSNTTGSYQHIISKEASDATIGWSLQTGPTGSEFLVFIAAGTYGYGYTVSGIISDDTWVHVAYVYNGLRATNATRLRIYVNGVLQTLKFLGTNIPAAIPANAYNVTIGHEVDPADLFFDGLIDEVKIWNYALTAEQVKTDYAGGAVRFGQ